MRGLLIQGGDYIYIYIYIYVCVYIYIYIYILGSASPGLQEGAGARSVGQGAVHEDRQHVLEITMTLL